MKKQKIRELDCGTIVNISNNGWVTMEFINKKGYTFALEDVYIPSLNKNKVITQTKNYKWIKKYQLKFNEILHRMYNLEILPNIQSRIQERIPKIRGFSLYQSEELEDFLHSFASDIHKNDIEEFQIMIGKDVDINKLINPNNVASGNHYPDMVDLPIRSIVYKVEAQNELRSELRKKLEELKGE
jgi:hypothetical protein